MSIISYINELRGMGRACRTTTRDDLRGAVENHACVWEEVGPKLDDAGLAALDQAYAKVVECAERLGR